jgi:hypothetical protein
VTTIHSVLVVIAALGTMAVTIEAGTASASLLVGVTVVRSCKVESGGTSSTISLACSNDVTRVEISGTSAPQVLMLTGGTNASELSTMPADARPAEPADAVRLITLNF